MGLFSWWRREVEPQFPRRQLCYHVDVSDSDAVVLVSSTTFPPVRLSWSLRSRTPAWQQDKHALTNLGAPPQCLSVEHAQHTHWTHTASLQPFPLCSPATPRCSTQVHLPRPPLFFLHLISDFCLRSAFRVLLYSYSQPHGDFFKSLLLSSTAVEQLFCLSQGQAGPSAPGHFYTGWILPGRRFSSLIQCHCNQQLSTCPHSLQLLIAELSSLYRFFVWQVWYVRHPSSLTAGCSIPKSSSLTGAFLKKKMKYIQHKAKSFPIHTHTQEPVMNRLSVLSCFSCLNRATEDIIK